MSSASTGSKLNHKQKKANNAAYKHRSIGPGPRRIGHGLGEGKGRRVGQAESARNSRKNNEGGWGKKDTESVLDGEVMGRKKNRVEKGKGVMKKKEGGRRRRRDLVKRIAQKGGRKIKGTLMR